MPDEPNDAADVAAVLKENTETAPYAKRRRKLRRYFINSNANLREAVYDTSRVLTVFDTERIIGMLAEHIDNYDGPETKKLFREGFRQWSTEWVRNIAQLTAQAVPLLPALTRLSESHPGLRREDYANSASRILHNLHQYDGTTPFCDWAADWVSRETQNTLALLEWVEQHRGAVYAGVWEVLSTCKDLGADEGTADELAADTWRRVSQNVDVLLIPGAPLHVRLKEKAVWTARAWKTEQIRHRETFIESALLETQADPLETRGRKVLCPVEC